MEQSTDRKGDWFQTFTGKKFYPFDPRLEEICIEDIAHSLSLLCRYNGHVREFYSVGQHSLRVYMVFKGLVAGTELAEDKKAQLCALLHDATEAYCGDMIRPIKRGMPNYKDMENNLWACILDHFELEETWLFGKGKNRYVCDYVKEADEIMLATERRDLMPNYQGMAWYLDGQEEPDPSPVRPIIPAKAEQLFLRVFNDLGGIK